MDHSGFAALAERHRRELHVHCYRMLASFDEAEDAVQETFLKAWRGRSGFDGGSQFRAWLYRIATNVCLDMLRHSSRRTSANSFAEVPWLQPYPDLMLEAAAPSDEQPEAVAISRETISLAFLALLGYLKGQAWFYTGLGVNPLLFGNNDAMALILFMLALPIFTFLLSPLSSLSSRKHEFEADAFAAQHTNAQDLVSALVKLYEDNASTLTPDPLHSAFYDSHPPASLRIGKLHDKLNAAH